MQLLTSYAATTAAESVTGGGAGWVVVASTATVPVFPVPVFPVAVLVPHALNAVPRAIMPMVVAAPLRFVQFSRLSLPPLDIWLCPKNTIALLCK